MALPKVYDYGDLMTAHVDDSADAAVIVEATRVVGTRSSWTLRWDGGQTTCTPKANARRTMKLIADRLLREAAS